MNLDENVVKKMARLARLSFDETDIPALSQDLQNILGLVEKMSQTDVSDVLPLSHPLGVAQPLRTDQVTEENQRDLFLQNAPESDKGLYIVPKVIETNE